MKVKIEVGELYNAMKIIMPRGLQTSVARDIYGIVHIRNGCLISFNGFQQVKYPLPKLDKDVMIDLGFDPLYALLGSLGSSEQLEIEVMEDKVVCKCGNIKADFCLVKSVLVEWSFGEVSEAMSLDKTFVDCLIWCRRALTTNPQYPEMLSVVWENSRLYGANVMTLARSMVQQKVKERLALPPYFVDSLVDISAAFSSTPEFAHDGKLMKLDWKSGAQVVTMVGAVGKMDFEELYKIHIIEDVKLTDLQEGMIRALDRFSSVLSGVEIIKAKVESLGESSYALQMEARGIVGELVDKLVINGQIPKEAEKEMTWDLSQVREFLSYPETRKWTMFGKGALIVESPVGEYVVTYMQ